MGDEMNFVHDFCEYRPLRPVEAVEADITAVAQEILALLHYVAGPG